MTNFFRYIVTRINFVNTFISNLLTKNFIKIKKLLKTINYNIFLLILVTFDMDDKTTCEYIEVET